MISITQRTFDPLTIYTEKIKKEMYASGTATVMMKDNKIIYEYYSGTHHFEPGARMIDESSQFNVYSTRVTYIGLAVAIAINEGYFSLEDKLSAYLDQFDKDILGEATIRHLLTRCTGIKFGKDKADRVFDLGMNIEGKRPDLLAYILKKTTGKTVAEILNEKVFTPLKLKETGWMSEGKDTLVCDIHSPDSYPTLRLGANTGEERNLFVSARELALWGNLHLNNGLIEGKQILPKEVFQLATTIQSPTALPKRFPKFGFLWWIKDQNVSYDYDELGEKLPAGTYQIFGASGCSCTVIPALNAVAVRMYNSLYTEDSNVFDYLGDIRKFGSLVVSCMEEYSKLRNGV
ncbi:penicillin-binding protein [Heyndrickxia shackletonii]|uniref:Penicillin-binding protein n=1 Tax=Heyndrickxia shackletonii TaxID=157838 RepID=A0A0Q3X076_9BACI|nr:serine hydrolase domain-containing protein [Heyndrickxia shackletonii]KQL55236.1 penicillin-binding protein [Heyndrickxia shackletonii]NEY98761.1 beta-lactamase family protein [Heyndrickxia shackletonii]